MSRLFFCLLLCGGLLIAGAASAQHRPPVGQALVARPSKARYARSLAPRGPFRFARRTHYRYAPSYHAYYNRSAYQPHLYAHRRPSGRSRVATLRPRVAGQ